MEANTLANGSMISRMAMVLKSSLTVGALKAAMFRARKMVKASSSGQMGPLTKGHSKTTPYMVMGSTNGTMAGHLKEGGKRTKWMVKEYLSGRMARSTRDTT